MPKKIAIRNRILDDTTGKLYRWFGIETCTPGDVKKALDEADGEDIVLDISSPGGLVVSGMEIYGALMEYPGKVSAHISYACSAATLIACAADEVLMSEAATYMIHCVQGYAEGSHADMEKTAEDMSSLDESIINAYEKKTGMSRDEIRALMERTTYMTIDEAIEKGFVDGKIERQNVMDMAASTLDIFSHDKAEEALKAISIMEKAGGSDALADMVKATMEEQTTGKDAVSDINKPQEVNVMTLHEFLNENAEAMEEYNNALADAKAEGITEGAEAENARLSELDAIANAVSPDALSEAKYGNERIDAKTLAFNTVVENAKAGAKHFEEAVSDAAESGVEDVATFEPDMGEEEDKSDEAMASYVNAKKGAK